MTILKDLTMGPNGTGANLWSPSLWFMDKNGSSTTVSSNIQTDSNGTMRLNTWTGGNSNNSVVTKNNTLDDGAGKATFAGHVYAGSSGGSAALVGIQLFNSGGDAVITLESGQPATNKYRQKRIYSTI
jgi:hypothetical protein